MTVLWINLAVVYLLSFLGRYFSSYDLRWISNLKPNRFFVFLVITSLALVSGLRNNIGDTYFYMHSYGIRELTWKDIDFTGDFGFDILQMYLQRISPDPQIMIFVTAILTNTLIVIALYRYTRVFEIAIYVYITSGMYIVSMNGIRQYLAASIAFIATKYLLNGNFKMYTLIILLASTMHKTALVLLPIYFIVRREAWTKITFLLLGFSIIIVLGFNQFSTMLFAALGNTQYGHYSEFSEGGASILRVVVTAVPVLLAFLGKEKLKELWPKSDYIVNMSIISMVFIVISLQSWIFARFNIYFGLYNLILISWVLKVFKDKDQKFIYFGILFCYFLYFYYEQILGLRLEYKSDYIPF
ncbi:EpsG family protein [Litchfieldia salsa]|uniref:Transmembrane protein EpsG n=1 Tax=Litchfieldia salsa TaxID=930152 RepID=A0A1H0VEF1_9BACI|nr:EpsG family protein [Litchfieldia salsa]SDP76731.1 transmembrane protein EpsG [Litchfieldia salsa]